MQARDFLVNKILDTENQILDYKYALSHSNVYPFRNEGTESLLKELDVLQVLLAGIDVHALDINFADDNAEPLFFMIPDMDEEVHTEWRNLSEELAHLYETDNEAWFSYIIYNEK